MKIIFPQISEILFSLDVFRSVTENIEQSAFNVWKGIEKAENNALNHRMSVLGTAFTAWTPRNVHRHC